MAMCKDFVRFSQGIIGLFRGFGIRLGRRCFLANGVYGRMRSDVFEGFVHMVAASYAFVF